MKNLFLPLFLSAFLFAPVQAQQNQEVRRTKSFFLFKDFRPAVVRQTFGRTVTVEKANLLLRDGTLVYLQGDSILAPTNASILGVDFDSTMTFMRVQGMEMGRVLAREGFNYLLCVTTFDRSMMTDEMNTYTNLSSLAQEAGFFDSNYLRDINPGSPDFLGYPVCDTYYFSLKGHVIPATEREVKRRIAASHKKDFKALMADRWWSWRDAESLARLLGLFPE
ncbi:MAG: hypothetical protein J6M53_06835 [Bacteroidaceae bacterium]|nr:hypothetical protein [Bacteroidaceae bacterium]